MAAASSPTAAAGNQIAQQQVLVNGQQQQQPTDERLMSPTSTAVEQATVTTASTAGTGGLLGITPGSPSASNKFVLTPEYIQHSEYCKVLSINKNCRKSEKRPYLHVGLQFWLQY